jgi:hypothetical protein
VETVPTANPSDSLSVSASERASRLHGQRHTADMMVVEIPALPALIEKPYGMSEAQWKRVHKLWRFLMKEKGSEVTKGILSFFSVSKRLALR